LWIGADRRKFDEPVDAAHPMIGGDVPLQTELVEQRLLRLLPLTHFHTAHQQRRLNQDFISAATPTFSTAVALFGPPDRLSNWSGLNGV